MKVSQSDQDGVRTLAIAGDFDTTDVSTFLSHIDEAVDQESYCVLIDVAQVKFMNSTALGSLVRAAKRLKQYGGDLAITGLHGVVKKAFFLPGLDRVIRAFDSLEEAAGYLRSVGDECVPVPAGPAIAYVFTGAEQLAAVGDDPREGTLRGLSEARLQLSWANDEQLDVATVLAPGVPLHVRFRLPLFQATHVFDVHTAVESVEAQDSGECLLTLRIASISDLERSAIRQFVRDLRFLGGEGAALS